jgi:hypothetical protein
MKHKTAYCSVGLALAAMTATAQARVTRIEITKTEPLAAGQQFGATGAYERVMGRYHGELDPASPLNAVIVDLDKAPRNARGMVEYSADFYIIRPVDITKGNSALFFEVTNRGNKGMLGRFNNAPRSNDPATAEQAGNGFLMRQGYTLVWNGWMAGLPATDGALRIEVPTIANIEQTTWDEFLFNDKTTKEGRLTYTAASTDKSQAKLFVRERNSEEPKAVPVEQWEFVNARTIRLLPEGTTFRMGAIYQLIYKATNPSVNGIGFASTRDLISFLRYAAADDAGTPNPLAAQGRPAITRTLSTGNSQSGRYLRDFIYSGFNEDETHRIVFDGANPVVAGGRIFLNYRFSQPTRIPPSGHGFMYFPAATFPYAYDTQADPFTGKRDGNLARCTASNTCPKIVHMHTGTEYWQGGGSLITTDPLGRTDATIPENVRIYQMSGTQHAGAERGMPNGVCAMAMNPVDYRPLLRAALVNLDRWVKDGTPPPASRYPRIADGTLVEKNEVAPFPGFTPAKGPSQRPRYDYGPEFDKGILGKALPTVLSESYRVLVPKVDSDGNEVAGLRLPEVVVPSMTSAGWNVRAPDAGGAGELCYLEGSSVPFAKTKAEREAKHDPRPSLEERYHDRTGYAERVRAAAEALQREGYILPEDAKRIVEKAATLTW